MINFAHAQAAAQQPSMLASFIPLILIFLIFYFLLIRPQQKKQKEHKVLLDSIQRGDEILSSGGILGKVIKVDNDKLTVEISKGVHVTIIRSTVADVIKK
jgi:preprotein translocase subunit YajC